MKRNGASLLLILFLQLTYLSVEASDFYWIGGSGNFNDIEHWSDQPGGKVNPGALLPDKDDNVYFDEFSFPDPGAEVVITSVVRCLNMYWGNVQNMPALKTDNNIAHYLVIYGGVKFNTQMIIDLDRPLYFRANTLGNVIDFGGNSFNGDFYFDNNGGWRITSEMNLLDNTVYFNQGTLSIEAELTCGSLVAENPVSRELYLNSSIINLQKSGTSVLSVQTDNLNLYPGNSKIIVSSANSTIETTGTKRVDFYDVLFQGNNGAIESNVTLTSFNDITFELDGSLKGENDIQNLIFTAGHSYSIYDGTQNIKTKFEALGECYAYIYITGDVLGGNISAELVNLNYLKVKNINASGNAVPFLANNSYNLGGNNASWNFVAPSSADYTWTGGAGDGMWGTPGNWDSGCVPSRNNSVIIPATFVVTIDIPAECKSLTIDDNATLEGSNNLAIFGSLAAGNCTWVFDGETQFDGGNITNTITINSVLTGSVSFIGDGEWTLNTNITVANNLELFKGKLHVNGNRLTVGQFVSTSTYNRELDLLNSNVDITDGVSRSWNISGSNFTLISNNSEIRFLSDGAELYNNSSDFIIYGRVVFNFPDGQTFLTNEGFEPTFESLEFKGNAKLFGNHQFDQLIFTKGKSYLFNVGSKQKITKADGLIAHGTCSEYISFKGENGVAYFDCDVSSSDLYRLRIEDVNVIGGIGSLTANESIGISGYDGWVFPDDLTGGTVYWTGNIDNDWFKAGNWLGGCLPNRKDVVIFEDAKVLNSYEVNISKKGSSAECLDMIWTNANLMSFTGDQPICIFGSLDFSGMVNANYSYSGDFYFKSENPSNINAGTVDLLSDLVFEGTKQEDDSWLAGSWILNSELKTSGTILLKNGDLISNSQDIEAKGFVSNFGVANTRSLSLGTSSFKLEQFEISPDGFTFDAGTSEIIFTTGGDLIVSTGAVPVAFYNVTFDDADGNAYIDTYSDDISFNNIVLNGNTYFRKKNVSEISFVAESIQLAVGKTYVFESSQTFVFGNVIANGACEGTIDITGSRADAAIFKAKAGVTNITVNSVNILNVNADPVDTFVAKASINLGGADGWRFEDEPAGTNLYWVDGTGNWDDPNHWSTVSGIKSGGCVPTAKDNVFFDDGSFTDTEQTVYTGASDIRCRTMDWTGSEAARPNFEMGATDISGVYIYGSLIFNSAVDINLSAVVNFYFRATELQEINTFGYVFPNIVEFDGNGGEWKLRDDMLMEGDCFIRYGKLITNGFDLECKSITSTDPTEGVNSRGLDIQNSSVTITGKEDVLGRSIYFNLADAYLDLGFEFLSANSTITFTDNAEVFIAGATTHNISFEKLIFEKDGELDSGFSGITPYVSYLQFKENGTVNGKNKFGTVELGRGFEFKFQNGKTYEMDYLLAEGSCFAPISLHSTKDTKQTTILAANNVTGNFLELKDINGDGSKGAAYTAANSFDLGNVTGWITDGEIAPIALYWVGKGADDSWNNHENWSRSQDGSEEGCVPTLNDDVFFTANSFLGSKFVELSVAGKCHSMTWNDDVDPGASFTVDATLQIGGFMDLTETMSLSMRGVFDFVGDGLAGDKFVDFANKSMNGDVIFNGDAQSWVWNSSLITSGDLYLESGSVTTKGNDFTVGRFSSLSLGDSDAVRKFDMSGSIVTVISDQPTGWNMKMNTTGGLNFIAADTKITFANGGGIYCETNTDVTFGFVDFMNNGIIRIKGAGQGYFGSVTFFEQGQIYGDNTFTNLEFTLGYENNTIESGKTITVIYDLKMEGVRCSYAFLKASTPGVKAFIYKPSGLFGKIYNAALTDIAGTSGSGGDHPVNYHFDNDNTTGFVLVPSAPGGSEDPPSFEGSFDQPREEWCSDVAVLDHVKGFPINSNTTFQWYYSADGTVGTYTALSGETNAVIEVTVSGFYKVEVIYGYNTVAKDGSLCKIESVIEVQLGTKSNVSLEITANNVKCFGQGNGRVVAKVANIQYPEYKFFWKDEAGIDFSASTSTNKTTWESTALNLTPGKYNITVADGKNCEFDTIVNIFDAYELLIDSIATKDLTCFTIPEGEILVAASGGTGNLSYFLDNVVQANENITGLYSGDYKVHVSDENLCLTPEQDITLNSNPEIVMDLNGTDLLCYNDNNGLFNPIVTGGVADYTYAWTGPAGYTATTANISGLAGGTYELTVTDAVNCPSVLSQELIEPKELITNELTIEAANCNGESSGEIFVEAAQGTPNYQYYLDGVESPTGIFSMLAPKDYALRIVDANSCVFEQNVTVTEPGEIGFLIEDIVLPTCKNINDGIVRITPYGGNSGYRYSWSGPSDYRSYSQNIENVVAGDYSLLITDKNNCSSENGVDLNLGLSIQLGLVVEQHIKVAGTKNGILSIETLEGTIPYSFTVTGPGGYSSVSPDNYDDNSFLIENLAGGVYTVVATDASGCSTVKKSIIIEEPEMAFAYIEERQAVGCAGSPVGELRAHAKGGNGTFTYTWSGPAGYSGTGETISGLAAGIYTVTATSAGQSATNTYELLAPDPLLASVANVENVSCNNAADGEIELDVNFGSADYTIAWTNGAGFLSSAKHILDLEPGTYDYAITSEYGCPPVLGSQAITEPTSLALTVTPIDISVVGLRDGEISATVAGGTAPYIFLISGPNGYSYAESANVSRNISVNGLEMGVYDVVVLDANECRIEDSKKVHEPDKLLLFVTSTTDVTCPGGTDGAVAVDVLGESDPANLTYSWTGDNYFRSTDKDVTGLKAGKYTVTVYDSAGDPGYESQSLQVVVEEPDKLVAEFWKKDISCFERTDGYINIHPKGGTPGYTYLWGGSGISPTNEDQQGLSEGTYTVQITDGNGCKSEITPIEIVEPKQVFVTVSDFYEPTCYGLEDGWIKLDISEGTKPYLVNWDNYGSITKDIFDVESGDYSYVVVDNNGCEISGSKLLNQPDTLIAEINNYQDVLCYGKSSGSATVDITGGTPNYTIEWSDGQETDIASDLIIGNYDVKVVDDHGCSDVSSVELVQPEALNLEAEASRPTTVDANDGSIRIDVTGGVLDYTINWSDQDLNPYYGTSIEDLGRGTYIVSVIDKNNCQLDSTIVLEYLYENRITIPKAFTPNNDSYNDYWDIDRIEFVQNLKIVIYDRWGKAVYKFNGTGNQYRGTPWTGADGNTNLPIGSYYYAVELDDEKPILGTVTILR